MIKDAIIAGLVLILAMLLFGQSDEPRAAIEDTSLSPRAIHNNLRAGALSEREVVARSRLFAPCPITPWALPRHVEEHVA